MSVRWMKMKERTMPWMMRPTVGRMMNREKIVKKERVTNLCMIRKRQLNHHSGAESSARGLLVCAIWATLAMTIANFSSSWVRCVWGFVLGVALGGMASGRELLRTSAKVGSILG